MTELRSQVNMRINSEMNISLTITSIVETAEEATLAGHEDAEIIQAWINAYAERVKELTGGAE